MTLHNEVECDGCGERVQPPRNAGWQVLFGIGADGVNVAEVDGHLCTDCRREQREWMRERRERFDAPPKASRPS